MNKLKILVANLKHLLNQDQASTAASLQRTLNIVEQDADLAHSRINGLEAKIEELQNSLVSNAVKKLHK